MGSKFDCSINLLKNLKHKNSINQMKKLIITSVALAAGATLGYSQGLITIANSTGSSLISTNNNAGGVGLADGNNYNYAFEVLTAPTSSAAPATSLTALANSWIDTGVEGYENNLGTIALYTSAQTGGLTTTSSGTGTASGTWAAATGSSWTTSTLQYYVIVGWMQPEASIGGSPTGFFSWPQVAAAIKSSGTLPAYFGVSSVGEQGAGGPNTVPKAANLLTGNAAASADGFTAGVGGFQLTPTATPEPASLALAGLGGLALLAFRRKNA